MKKLLFAVVLLLNLIQHITAQEYIYKIEPEVTKGKIDRYISKPTIYQVSYQQIDIPDYDTTYTETAQYAQLKQQIATIMQDSTTIIHDYQTDLALYHKINTIPTLIDSFIDSDTSFKHKKNYLIQAQLLSDSFQLNFLIYADKTTNKSQRVEFFRLRLVPSDLNTHLQKIKTHILQNNPAPRPLYFPDANKLRQLRTKLTQTPQYDMHLTPISTHKEFGFLVGSKITDITTIAGNYKEIGKYNYMRTTYGRFIENQLLAKDTIAHYELDQYTQYLPETLMQDINTGNYLFGSDQFLTNYGTDITIIKLMQTIDSLGYSTSQKGDEVYIHTNKAKLLLTYAITQNIRNGNPNYITQLANSVNQFNQLCAKAPALTSKLVNHFNAHRHRTMSDARLQTWQADLNQAHALLNKLDALHGQDLDSRDYFMKQLSINTIANYTEFIQVVQGSNQILGK